MIVIGDTNKKGKDEVEGERVRSQLTGREFNSEESLVLINEVMAEDDAGDPLLESYQKYRKR